jgi:hypothetical protein
LYDESRNTFVDQFFVAFHEVLRLFSIRSTLLLPHST